MKLIRFSILWESFKKNSEKIEVTGTCPKSILSPEENWPLGVKLKAPLFIHQLPLPSYCIAHCLIYTTRNWSLMQLQKRDCSLKATTTSLVLHNCTTVVIEKGPLSSCSQHGDCRMEMGCLGSFHPWNSIIKVNDSLTLWPSYVEVASWGLVVQEWCVLVLCD